VLAGVIATRYPERATQGKGKAMLTDLLLIAAPFVLGILLVAGGANITDTDYIETMNRERKTK